MGTGEGENKGGISGIPKPPAIEPKKIKGEPTLQTRNEGPRFKAPPPKNSVVPVAPVSPFRTGSTNPGPSTRVDSPHGKQKTPHPQAPPKAPAPVSKPRVANPIALPPARRDASGPVPIPSKHNPAPQPPPIPKSAEEDGEKTPANGIPLGPAAKTGGGAVDYSSIKLPGGAPVPEPDELQIPNLRQVPYYSRLPFLFPDSPVKMAVIWGVITLAVLAPIGLGVVRCQSEKEPAKIEQIETQKKEGPSKKAEEKPKPAHSYYIPKALRNPPAPQIRNLHGIPRARNSLRS